MPHKKIQVTHWDSLLQGELVDFINYYLSGGPIEKVVPDSLSAIQFLKLNMPWGAASQYRQKLGGLFTSHEQLLEIPGVKADVLEQLAHLLSGLHPSRLKAVMPCTTRHNHVEAFVNGPECLRILLEEIDRAEKFIHFSVMLYFNDTAGNRVAAALLAALERGVEVRLMVDYGMSLVGYGKKPGVGDFTAIAERLQAAGARVINTFHTCYSDLNWPERRLELALQGVAESSLYYQDCIQKQLTKGLNVVNHRKYMVVDGLVGLVGSLNVGDQYLYETPLQRIEGYVRVQGEFEPVKGEEADGDGGMLGVPAEELQWHDGMIRIRGEAILSLNQLFASQWLVLGGDLFDPEADFYWPDVDRNAGEEECSLIFSFPGNPVNLIQQYHLSLVEYLSGETIVVNPYLIDQDFWDKVKGLTGEQSRMLTICNSLQVNDHPTNLAAVRGNMYGPCERGVVFCDYSQTERFSHWKISYDGASDCVFHGSYNMNDRSSCHDFEMGILVKGKRFAAEAKALMDYDLRVSERITDNAAFFRHPGLHPSTYLHKLTEYFM